MTDLEKKTISLDSLYKNLTNEAKDYYLSLDQSLINQLLIIVKDSYEYKLENLNAKSFKLKKIQEEKIKTNFHIEERKNTLDEWINSNQSCKNTIEYKDNLREMGKIYFELKDSKRDIEEKFTKDNENLRFEKENLEKNKLHQLIYLLRENWKNDKKQEKEKIYIKIREDIKKDQERQRTYELEQERIEHEEIEQKRIVNLSKIRKESNKKGVTQLIHFTTINYLSQILNEGIFSLDKLRKDKVNSQDYIPTDQNDFGNNSEWISTSVSFPNYKMLYTKRKQNAKHLKQVMGWAVISLESKILWELDCRYVKGNAAQGKYFTSPVYASYEKFNLMFEQTISRSSELHDKYTTNSQAEVLVKEHIPTKYIKEIFFENNIIANQFQDSFNPKFKITVDRKYFSPRSDFEYQRNLDNG